MGASAVGGLLSLDKASAQADVSIDHQISVPKEFVKDDDTDAGIRVG
jgi:hypothetical protein